MNWCRTLFLKCFTGHGNDESAEMVSEDMIYLSQCQPSLKKEIKLENLKSNDLQKTDYETKRTKKLNISLNHSKTMETKIKKKKKKKKINLKRNFTNPDLSFEQNFLTQTQKEKRKKRLLNNESEFKNFDLMDFKLIKRNKKVNMSVNYILEDKLNYEITQNFTQLEKMSIGPEIFIKMRQGNIKNHYEFEEKLGEGGFGTVFIAIHKKMSKILIYFS